MKKILMIGILGLLVFITSEKIHAKPYDSRTIKTENGAVLEVYSQVGIEYEVVGIKTEKEEIIIPETIDGERRITSIDLMDIRKKCEKVKKIHLSKNIEDINAAWEDSDALYYLNIFYYVPNVETITIDEENPYLRVENNIVYDKKDNTLLAITPKTSGVVTIGKDVNKVIDNATYGLKNVTGFVVEEGNANYKSIDGILYNADGSTLLRFPIAKPEKTVKLPEGLTYIEKQAAEDLKYTEKIIMPSTLRVIDEMAFEDANLKEVKLNSKLERIYEKAFSGTKLKNIKLPKKIGYVEIGSIPVKKLIISEKTGEIEAFIPVYDFDEPRVLIANVLVVKNPAISLLSIENNLEINESIFKGVTVYAYKGSRAYKEMRWLKKKKKVNVKLKILKGKEYKIPNETGKIDTSWYNKKKKQFYISTPAQLAGLSYISRKKEEDFYGKKIILKKNLNMKRYKNFHPIREFNGTFEGNGKTIKNLRIYRFRSEVGLFAHSYCGEIRNLNVKGNVVGGNYTGGIVGNACDDHAKLKNCNFIGTVRGYGYSGQLIGYTY